jgi:hypothetical protein
MKKRTEFEHHLPKLMQTWRNKTMAAALNNRNRNH